MSDCQSPMRPVSETGLDKISAMLSNKRRPNTPTNRTAMSANDIPSFRGPSTNVKYRSRLTGSIMSGVFAPDITRRNPQAPKLAPFRKYDPRHREKTSQIRHAAATNPDSFL